MRKVMAIRNCRSDRIFFTITGIVLALLVVLVSYPIIYVVSASLSSAKAVTNGRVILFPVDFSLEGYQAVFRHSRILSSFLNTFMYTGLGTLINVVMTIMCAYPLSRKDLKGRGFLTLVFTFTMFFSGGLVPSYLQIVNLGLIDTLGVMVLPGALSVYNMLVMRTNIESNIPSEMIEAAFIDGCSDVRFLVAIVLPLSKAVIAVVAMFSAVGHWNSYFNAMIYLNTPSKYPIQIILREILIMNQVDLSMVMEFQQKEAMTSLADVLKYSLIVVSTAPILMVYPFIQKYFVKGVMIGSVKG